MSQEIVEKTNEISEGIVDYMTSAGELAKSTKRFLDRSYEMDKRGYLTGPSAKPIQYGALVDLGTQAQLRGAGMGFRGGAAGGAALGGSIASGGIPVAIDRAIRGFKGGKGAIGKIAGALIGGLVAPLARGAIGAGLGGAAGGIAGFKGGRETGAKIASAGLLGAPAALAAGPVAGGVLGLGGAAIGSDIMKALEKSQKKMAAGGGQGIIFRS